MEKERGGGGGGRNRSRHRLIYFCIHPSLRVLQCRPWRGEEGKEVEKEKRKRGRKEAQHRCRCFYFFFAGSTGREGNQVTKGSCTMMVAVFFLPRLGGKEGEGKKEKER